MWNNSKDKIFMGPWENNRQKLQISQNEILHMTILPVFSQISCEIWNLFSQTPVRTFSLELFPITYYKLWLLKLVWKRMRYGLKYSVTRFLSTEN